MLSLLGAFAEFERAIIRERQAEGIALAKKAGKYKGRARALCDGDVDFARELWGWGVSVAEIARRFGVHRSTIYRALSDEK